MLIRLIAAAVFVMLSLSAHAEAIVDAAYVKAALARGAIVWDVRGTAQYRRGHIPGAVSIGEAGSMLRNAVTEDFVPVAEIEQIFGEAGIDPAKEIIVYGDRGSSATYFGRYALRYFGAKRVAAFHDGLDGWVAAGNAPSTTDSRLPPLKLKLEVVRELAISTAEVVAKAKQGGAQLVDVRSEDEFRGDDVRAIRGGHIPGAVLIPYENNWQDPETYTKLAQRKVKDSSGASLAPLEKLKSLYAKLDPKKETIVYCQSGVRAAETATVLEQLGFNNVKIYDSSWLGYAARLDAPVENETFFNVGALSGRIASMGRRIEQLEGLILEMRAAMTPPAVATTKQCGGKPC